MSVRYVRCDGKYCSDCHTMFVLLGENLNNLSARFETALKYLKVQISLNCRIVIFLLEKAKLFLLKFC